MSQSDDRTIRISLEISVPVGGGEVQVKQSARPPLKMPKVAPDISHPTSGGTTFVKQVNNRWFMCAFGRTDAGVQHIFAKVYDGGVAAPSSPPAGDPDCLFTVPDSNAIWRFDLLPVPGTIGPGNTKTLVVWSENPSPPPTYEVSDPISFTTVSATYTSCEIPEPEAAKVQKPQAKDWSSMPDRWQFEIAGVSNASSCGCKSLDGTWVLKREKDLPVWHRQIVSFLDAKKPAWWRLVFNRKDGFWYLECVTDLKQLPGATITYRRHESAWDPCGANEMILLTDHGYCNVPESVTLYPA